MAKFLEKLLGDPNKKTLKKFQPIVDKINGLETEMEKLTNDQLQGKTAEFKARLEKGETLDDLLPEAFAVVRETGKRLMGMRHYDVQLIGGITLHRGIIAEMRTGEGKTLVATLPTYLNALGGKGVHVITVNDYLAKRDAVWMAQIYDFLGLTIGIVQNQRVSFIYDASFKGGEEGGETDQERDETGSFKVEDEYLRPVSRKEVYQCDSTYGTNNEFGFDYLRDNMVQTIEDMVMRHGEEMQYAIIDEVDSILIDESRTPLIISAPAEEAAEQYYQFARLVKQLKENEDYNVDEKMKSSTLTEEGIHKFEQWLGVENIYVEGGIRLVHHVEQALKAEVLFKRDKDYVVDGGQVVIIDEFTGRKMPGRRYSEGLHQAIEAKEGVDIQRESRTLATITFQNLFRMYSKLSGMTGTAETEKEEFFKIYGLDVLVIPTNKPDARIDNPDRIYKTEEAKYRAVVKKIVECREKGQPILVGTISVEKNEELSDFLTAQGIDHEALNAKNHEREGEIVAQAGSAGSVTLATNMAGRGVDIKLGGSPVNSDEEKKVLDAGGLFVLGTERHESRRIDNQLRGRSARQGDKGETQFFVSTDDELMRIFAGDRLKTVMERLNVPDDMPIEQNMITKMLENAQKKVESMHFDTRKHLLSYDDVLNRHREVVYEKRRTILDLQEGKKEEGKKSSKEMVLGMIQDEIEFVVSYHTNPQSADVEKGKDLTWNMKEVFETMKTIFPLGQDDRKKLFDLGKQGEAKIDEASAREEIVQFLMGKAEAEYVKITDLILTQLKDGQDADELLVGFETGIMLRSIDSLWVDHLVSLNYLRTGIGLRGYGQRDPLVEYKKESYHMFNQLLANIQKEVVYSFFKVGVGLQLAPTVMAADKMTLEGAKKTMSAQGAHIEKKERKEDGTKVGRNDPCPCGSGKKYKKCHGK
jgi:preprotein translocase subunit SecA